MGGWGQTKIKDHLSPAKAGVGTELGNKNEVSSMLNVGNVTKERKNKNGYCEISKQVVLNDSYEMLLKEQKAVEHLPGL